MSSTTLNIVLQGLLALVPNNEPGGANQMTVLMLDGNHSHSIKCVSDSQYKHHPKLRLYAEDKGCGDAHCTTNQGVCTCEGSVLTRKEIWLEIQPQPQPTPKDLQEHDQLPVIPNNPQEAARPGYIVNMAAPPFNMSLNEKYLSASPPSNLVARLQFPFDSITPCELGKRFDENKALVYPLGFRTLGTPSRPGQASQAMAQKVLASVTIPDSGAAGPKVILHLKDLGTKVEAAIPLKVKGQAYWVSFSNTSDPLPFDDPCDDGVARHFALFYKLAAPPPTEQLIPHVRFTQPKLADDLEPQECAKIPPTLNSPIDRPICPLVMFSSPVKR